MKFWHFHSVDRHQLLYPQACGCLCQQNPVIPAAVDGFMMGLGFTLVLIVLGAFRELVGQGTLFSGMELLFGDAARSWKIEVIHNYPNFLFAVPPPGLSSVWAC